MRTFTSAMARKRSPRDHFISPPTFATSSTMTSKPVQRLSELNEDLVKSMSPNDLAIHIGSLVKAGKLDQKIAMDRFSELSQSLQPIHKPVMSPDDLTDLSYRVQLKNMPEKKYTLKFDLKTKGINLYFRGKCKHKIRYDEDIKSFESDEDNAFILRTTSLDLMEFEAEGLEEKNAILNVLERFEQDRRSAEDAISEEQNKEDHEKSETDKEDQDAITSLPSMAQRSGRDDLVKSLRIPVYKQILKEGELEKQGHGKGALSWPIRYVEIKPGQLAYYKPSNKKQPLNILTLDRTVTIETSQEGFEIKLAPKREQNVNDRSYNFRVSKTHGNFQAEVNQWLHAIELAIQGTNEKEIMMSLCGNSPSTRTLTGIRRIEPQQQSRRKSHIFQKPKKPKGSISFEPAPAVDLEDPNIAKLLCQLKQQINHLLLISEEIKNERIKSVFDNLSEICKFMEDQVRGNPDDNLPFQPLNRVGSIRADRSPGFNLPDTPTGNGVTEKQAPGDEEKREDWDQANSTLTEATTIAQMQHQISLNPPKEEIPSADNTNKDITQEEPVPIDPDILRRIPDPPPYMQEAIDFFLLIEKRPTGDPKIPCCPPNMPETNKYIKTVILGIPDIPPPPPNLQIVDATLGIDSVNLGIQNSVMRKVNMKPLNWNKIGSKQVKCNSMWFNSHNDLDIDIDKLEHLFKEEKVVRKNKCKSPEKPQKIVYLGDKRAMGIDIFLRRTRFNFEELDEILNNALERENSVGHKICLQLEELEDLSRYPTEEDNDLFRAVKESPDKMVKADQFIHTVCHLPFYKERVDVILLMREIPTNTTHIQEPIKILTKACAELNSSVKFVKILGLVLKIGNHINSGSNRGDAGGFHLSALSKLITYKGIEPKFSLLHFIVQQVMDGNEELLNFDEELSTVHKAIDASVEGILAEIDLMKQQLNKIKKTRELMTNSKGASNYQQFTTDVEEFLQTFESKHRELIKEHDQLRSAYSQVLVKYGETEAESDEFMAQINDFIRDFKKVSTELIRKRINEKKAQDNILRSKSTSAQSCNKVQARSNKKIEPKMMKRSSTVAGVKSPLMEAQNEKGHLPTIQSEEELKSEKEKGAAKIEPVNTKACEPKTYDNLQLEKKGYFKTEWKNKRFVLSGKQLRCMTSKNDIEDVLHLGRQTQIYIDTQDLTVIEIKIKDKGKEKKIRIKCSSPVEADEVMADFKQS
ncbi:Formin-F-like [Oopsacas minuta]|uniref:Formin-F-like n=1 Tax=Oopsacas minuta TaxID=111878 RepID=A0AAV7JEP7_9METZ|nr:Formin-F-like [Oopsacas minuta]